MKRTKKTFPGGGKIDPHTNDPYQVTIEDKADILWDVDEPDRFAKSVTLFR